MMEHPQSEQPQANQKISFEKALVLWCVGCTIFAHLIPEKVLTDNPGIDQAVTAFASVFKALHGLARHSTVPEVVAVFYASLLLLYPALAVFTYKIFPLGDRPFKNVGVLKTIGFSAIGIFFYVLFLNLFTFHTPAIDRQLSVSAGGRGDAFYIALCHNRLSMGLVGGGVFFCMSVFLFVALSGFNSLFKRRSNHGRKSK